MNRKLIITIYSILLLLAHGGMSGTLMAQDRAVDAPAMPSCLMVLEYDATSAPELPDSVFNARAGIAIYKVNSTELRADNDFVRLLDSTILPLANKNDWKLLGIEVRGGASPEGPYDNNVRLAEGRAANILQYINERLVHKCAAEELQIKTVPEDYAYLLWLLEQRGDAAADTLRSIIESRGIANHAAIKADMQKAGDGRLWSRLLADYFPSVRAGRVMLFFMPYRQLAPELPEPAESPLNASLYSPFELPETFPYSPELFVQRPHMLSVSSNILCDAFYMPGYGWAPMPNVGLEFFPKKGKFTYRLQFMFPYYHRWKHYKFFQIRDYHIEVRRYFKPGFYHTGWYLGAYVNANKYGIGLSAMKGWQGEGIGGALKAGYVMPIGRSKRWRIDFHVAFGGYVTRYDPYVYGNPITGETDGDYYYDWVGGAIAFHRRNHRFTWFGPTEAGITISYDVLYWRRSHKGVSFLSKERVE